MSTNYIVNTNNTSVERSSSVTIPDHLKCPLTLDLLNDPVICEDGNTYERTAIEEWFRLHDTSPLTNEHLRSKGLIPNRRIKDGVDAFKATSRPIMRQASVQPIAAQHVAVQPLRIEVTHQMVRIDGKKCIILNIIPPVLMARLPIRFIFMVDISGSMSTSVDQPGKERTGYTRLDLVKYTISVIMSVLGDDDYVSIIPFSTSASVLVPLTRTNANGKALIKSRLQSMEPTNSTNIYDALRLAMETSRNPICRGYTTVNLLLTDGLASQEPPLGLIPTLERDMKKGFNGIFSTFGFGYELDSKMLKSISDLLEGSFVFIPDATLLATGVINNVASSLSIVKDKFRFNVNTNCEIRNIVGGKVVAKNGPELTISVSMIQSEQPQTVLIEMSDIEPVVFQYTYNDITVNAEVEGDTTNMKVERTICHTMTELDKLLDIIDSRQSKLPDTNCFANRKDPHVIACIQRIEREKQDIVDTVNSQIQTLIAYLQCIERETRDERITTLLRELDSTHSTEGQVAKAFASLEYYNKWGKHYVRSFTIAHNKKQCNNYKDISVQAYGGDLFKQIRESTDELFNTLPPPTPSERIQQSSPRYGVSSSAPAPPPPAPTNMSQFNNPYDSDSCLGPRTVIQLENGLTTTISRVKKGTILLNEAPVKCVVEYPVNGLCKFVWFKKKHLEITPWHPVFVDGKWAYPNDLVNGDDSVLIEDFVTVKYNFVLDSKHVIPFTELDVCTLAHGFTDNDVIKHDFYGTERILECLKTLPGYSQGRVIFPEHDVERNASGDVCNYIFNP